MSPVHIFLQDIYVYSDDSVDPNPHNVSNDDGADSWECDGDVYCGDDFDLDNNDLDYYIFDLDYHVFDLVDNHDLVCYNFDLAVFHDSSCYLYAYLFLRMI